MADPRYLYKFRQFGNPHQLRILTQDEFFFSSARHFNDPFDSRIPIRYDEGTRDEVVAHWSFFFANEFPADTQARHRQMAEQHYDSGTFRTPEFLERARRVSQEYPLNNMGVFSLSPVFANILLWSHYSQSHSGFALGFLTQDLRNLALTYTVHTGQIMTVQQVKYSATHPDLNAYRNTLQERFDGQFLTKADDWNYEQEFRILLKGGTDQTVRIPVDLVRRVILGCQVTEPDRQTMIDILRDRRDQPGLFQAQRAERSFALRFRRIPYETTANVA